MADDRQHRRYGADTATGTRHGAGALGRRGTDVLGPNALCLDLGSGGHPQAGFDGVDRVDLGQRWVVDLDVTPWPWADDSVDAVWCSHLVEHVADLVPFMNELHRVMVNGALATISHPYAWSDWGVGDPTHRRLLTQMSWFYFDRDWRQSQGIEHYPITADFAVVAIDTRLTPAWAQARSEATMAGAWDDSIIYTAVNVIQELSVSLECRK